MSVFIIAALCSLSNYMIVLACISALMLSLLSSSSLVLLGQSNFSEVNAQQGAFSTTTENNNNCISYNNIKRLIKLSCKFATLTDIYNQINNHEVLDKQPQQQQGIWLLNANLTIDKGSTLTIDT